jgi:hypothetical protein
MQFVPFSKMPNCTAHLKTRPGVLCTNRANYHGVRDLCRVHHRIAMQDNPEYKAAYNLSVQGPPPVDPAVALAEVRAGRITSNNRKLAELPNASVTDIMRYSRRLITLWFTENIPGFDLVEAYVILRYHSIQNPNYKTVLEAAVRLTLLANGYHPDHAEYNNVPIQERAEALGRVKTAIQLFDTEVDIHVLSRNADQHWARVHERIRLVEEEEARIRREAQRAAFEQRLRQEPVVFKRDPEGGIDLKAFATDEQSVHRSSVQTSTERAVHMLLTRPVIEGKETLVEIVDAFNDVKLVKWSPILKEKVVTEITNDYFNTEAFSIPYGKVLDHIWCFITTHEHKRQLIIRLAQEVQEGIKQCSNGKMARLVNVLRGLDDTLDSIPSPEAMKLMFQNKISRLMERPLVERRALALSLFDEYKIPDDERDIWLAPLLE